MNILISVDSSSNIGTGHVFRCLSLAIRLRHRGHDVQFICGEYEGNLNYLIESRNFKVWPIKDIKFDNLSDANETLNIMSRIEHVDWVISDGYEIDAFGT